MAVPIKSSRNKSRASPTAFEESASFVENGDEFFAGWPQYVREMVWLTDGQFFDEACVMMSTLDKYRELGVQVALRGHGGEIARMQWAYELTCNRLILACKTQPELKVQLFRQMCCGLNDNDFATLLVRIGKCHAGQFARLDG